MQVLVAFIITLLAWMWYKHVIEHKDFPPGYLRLPWLGCVLSMAGKHGGEVATEATKMLPNYGTIVGFVFGTFRMVVVSDFALAREVFRGERFALRKEYDYVSRVRGVAGRVAGIITTSGEQWRTHRRFALTALKELGVGKRRMDMVIADEGKLLASSLVKSIGTDFKIDQTFNGPALNVLWRVVSGKRFQYDDPWLKRMQGRLAIVLRHADTERPFPTLARLFPSFFLLREKMEHSKDLKEMLATEIAEHRKNMAGNLGQSKDLMELYLTQMKHNPALNVHDLIGMCQDFFEAGGETTGSTLSWLLLYLALNQEVQEKCFQEICGVSGLDKVRLEFKQHLPFCEATILEVQRISCVALASLGHSSSHDNWIGGYKIPKFVDVFYNIHAFHMDPAYWGDPESFRPERFLQQVDGEMKVVKPDRFVPFGFGSRSCIGQLLANATLFIFTITILQAVKILPPLNHEMPDPAKFTCGLTKSPMPYYVQFQARA